MKWLKRLLKVIAYLLLLLLLAAVGFREWCVWRLPRMRAEVNAAWKDYAGIALDDVPKRFPAVETNEAALNLEKAAAKLGICLAPKKNNEKCPRNVPTEEAVREFESLSVKNPKGDKQSRVTEYVNHQMESPNPIVDSTPPELEQFMRSHEQDFIAVITAINGTEPPQWEFKRSPIYSSPPTNLASHIKLFGLLTAEILTSMNRRTPADTEIRLRAQELLIASLIKQPDGVSVLIAIAEGRQLIALLRKFQRIETSWNDRIYRIEWSQARKKSAIYFRWQTTTPESVKWFETVDENWQFDSWPTQTKGSSTLTQRFTRPWVQISILQMNLAAIHDMKYLDSLDRCQPNLSWESIPGVSFPEETWYKPKWYLVYSGVIRHPELSWWNPTGKIIYAIGGPSIGEWKKVYRLALETELTQKVMILRDTHLNDAIWPASIPGIESSICRNEKWTYTVNSDGSASLAFSGKPDWGTMKGAKVPLQWTEPAPGK